MACRWRSSAVRWSPSTRCCRPVSAAPALRGRAALAWDGVQFELLHPASGLQSDKPNARSCVLRIRDAEGRTALLLGDLPAEEERQPGP